MNSIFDSDPMPEGDNLGNGTQTYSSGQLLVESARRFKGQAADAAVITEVDFEELDPMAKRMLFVAITRARLEVV